MNYSYALANADEFKAIIMKKNRFVVAMSVVAISATLFLNTCKKNAQNSGCVVGGFSTTVTYVFYISKNYNSGYINVVIKDSNGNNVIMDRSQTKIFDATPPTDACGDINRLNRADAGLTKNQNYTWTASDAIHSWHGTIAVACSPTSDCNAVQIDQ